jgi:uncharacterized protein YqgV (UPF0045/DUF77 family)
MNSLILPLATNSKDVKNLVRKCFVIFHAQGTNNGLTPGDTFSKMEVEWKVVNKVAKQLV